MTAQPQQPFLGVTPPISVDPPKQTELQSTQELIDTLRSFNVFESEEESRKREQVLSKLNIMVKQFVRRISLARNLPEAVANEAGGKIFTFGSYRLGVHGTGADIDTLCVVPKYVQREDFFDDMYKTLQETQEVTELTAVPDSYVPVIKMCFDGIPIDLVFAKLELSSVPDHLELRDDNLLKHLDERCVRSLNGSRVTDEILRLVPSIPTFRTALRCIKLWAKKRAIYSNVMGFLGGVAWALCVARVCQLYPNATASVVVNKFFQIMGRWNWPQPVLLKQIEDGPLPVRVWNPKLYPADRSHRMPIITPAYPSMCSTHNVTASTLKVMIDELNRAADLTNRIMVGAAKWTDLFAKHDFFHKYKYYLQVIASSNSEDTQRVWSALVESRLRHLVLKLEFVETLNAAHPFIKGFEKTVVCQNEKDAIDAGRGIFHAEAGQDEDTGTPAEKPEDVPPVERMDEVTAELETVEQALDQRTVHTMTFYIGLAIEPKAAGVNAPRKVDISWPTSEFTKMCKQWEKYDDKAMGICVKYIKSSSLPNDVFDEGEIRGKLKRGKSAKTRVGQLTTQATEQPFKKRKSSLGDSATDEVNAEGNHQESANGSMQ